MALLDHCEDDDTDGDDDDDDDQSPPSDDNHDDAFSYLSIWCGRANSASTSVGQTSSFFCPPKEFISVHLFLVIGIWLELWIYLEKNLEVRAAFVAILTSEKYQDSILFSVRYLEFPRYFLSEISDIPQIFSQYGI